jgi:sugar transport protein
MSLNLCCDVRLSFKTWNLLAAVTGAFLINKVGRRTLFIVSSAGMLACQYLWSFAILGC